MLLLYIILSLIANGIFLFVFRKNIIIGKSSLLPLLLFLLMVFIGINQYYNRGKYDFNSNNFSECTEEEWEKVSVYIFRSLIIFAFFNIPFIFFFNTYVKILSLFTVYIGFIGGPIYYKIKNKK